MTTESKKPFPLSFKLGMIALIVASTLAYSIVEKRKIEALTSAENHIILKSLPDFEIPFIKKELGILNSSNVFDGGYEAVLVHFWGTWCAPCEAELPEFLEFVESFKAQKVKAVLLAVQDDDTKIKKFLRRFGDLPENVVVVHDQPGKSMLTFGTVKVPETYLFAKNGKTLNRYVGPQDWKHNSYKDRMKFYLSSLGGEQTSYKIETH